MDINKYFDGILEKIENLSDNEFDQLLLDSGIENCPIDDTNTTKYYNAFIYNHGVYKVENRKLLVDSIIAQNKNVVKVVANTYDSYNVFNNETKAAS